MIALAGLLVLALLGQPQPRTYYWRDAVGQTHITNTPPPADAELLQSPPPTAVEAGRLEPVEPHAPTGQDGHPLQLTPLQRQAWEALDLRLLQARVAGDRRTLEAVTDSLMGDCLWGHGLWARPLLPFFTVLLMGLVGWWLTFGLRPGVQVPLMAGCLLTGLALAHLFLTTLLYRPQAVRLHQNLGLLEHHLGTGRVLRPERQALLQTRYAALDRAASPLQAPWRFPAEVQALRTTMKQVMVEP